MSWYKVTVIEELRRSYTVEAEDESMAETMISDAHTRGEVCLYVDDYGDVRFEVEEVEDPLREMGPKLKFAVVQHIRKGDVDNMWLFDDPEDAKLFAQCVFDRPMTKADYDTTFQYGFWVGVFRCLCTLGDEGEWVPDGIGFDPGHAYEHWCLWSDDDDWQKEIPTTDEEVRRC